ncbi:MAG TPA: hypothetical protein VHO28_06710 [Ignavibacteriales bacterium]|nr:hypothetical protein [Ignavibacteriales bacterium]
MMNTNRKEEDKMEDFTLDTIDTAEIHEPVKKASPSAANLKIEKELTESVQLHTLKNQDEISARIKELDRELDIERALALNASVIGIGGLLLGITINKKWLTLPAAVLAFLLQHSTQGWCPPLPLLRSMGIRTRKEIDQEKYALKALRGDFSKLPANEENNIAKAETVLSVVKS